MALFMGLIFTNDNFGEHLISNFTFMNLLAS